MKNRRLIDSFQNAIQGIIYTMKNERNFKIHILAACMVLLLVLFLNVDAKEFLILTLVITMVLVAELFNTAIEAVVDLICGQKINPLAKIAKDAAAGGVFITAVSAMVTGYVILYKKLTDRDLTPVITAIKSMPVYISLICVVIVLVLSFAVKIATGAKNLLQGGMPSIHSALAFSVATCILFLTGNIPAITMGFFLALLVAQSRVEGRIHSLIQVVTGSALGMLVTMIVFQLGTRP